MTFARLSGLAVTFTFLLACSSLNLNAEEPQRTDGFHLNLLVQQAEDNPNLLWNMGDPVLHLQSGDFWVQQGGSRLWVDFLKSGVEGPSDRSRATRLLVIVSPSVSDPEGSLGRLTRALHVVWRQGWQTAIVRPDGSTTGYAAGPSSITQAVPAAMPFSQSYLTAVKDLKGFDGTAIVLYLTGSAKGDREVPTPSALIESAKDSMAMLYVADGGSPSYADWTMEPYSPRSYDFPLPIYDQVRAHGEYICGVKHEVSAQSALKAMRLDLEGRYDLYIRPQPGHPLDPHQPISIEVKSKNEIRTIFEADGIGKDILLEISQR